MALTSSLSSRFYTQSLETGTLDSQFENWSWPYYVALVLVMWPLTIWVAVKKHICRIFGLKLKSNSFWVDGISRASKEIIY